MMVVRTIQNLDNDTIFHHPLPMSTLRERTKTMWTLIQRIISMWGIFLWRGLICLGSSGVSHRRGWRWKLTWLCRDRIGDGVMIFGARGLCCLGCMGSQGCFHFGITGGCQSQAWDMAAAGVRLIKQVNNKSDDSWMWIVVSMKIIESHAFT